MTIKKEYQIKELIIRYSLVILIVGFFWGIKYAFPELTNQFIRYVIRFESTIIAFVLNLFHSNVYLIHHDDYLISSISLDGINYLSHEQSCTGLKELVYTIAAVPLFSNDLRQFIKYSILLSIVLFILNFIRSIVLIESYYPYKGREAYDSYHFWASIVLIAIMSGILIYMINKSKKS